MLYCEKATSLLFPPVDKVIQAYSCRIVEFFACPVQNKKTQKNTVCKDDCVGPAPNKIETVCIDTDSLQEPSTSTSDYSSTETSEQTKEDKMGKTNDTLNYWEPSLLKGARLTKRGKQNEYEYQRPDSKKMYRRRRRGQISRAAQSCKNPVCVKSKKEGYPSKMVSKLVNTKAAFDRKSLISLYRKRRRPKINENQDCTCPNKIKKRRRENMNFKLELKPKNLDTGQNINLYNNEKEKTCYKGICAKAIKNKHKDFVCTCKQKREPGVICSDNTCGKGHKIGNKCSFDRLKNRVSYLCRKSLQKIKICRNPDPNKICEEGVCKEASKRNNPDISCTCKQKIKKCTDDICSLSKAKISQLSQRIRCKQRLTRQDKIRQNIMVQNEMEQTGDPFFEIKVDAIDMCVLNSSEIKDKVSRLGEEKKRQRCICPSHEERKQYILERETCLGGACEKAVKNKKTDFSCKCLKNKIWTCTDSICNKSVTFGTGDNNAKNCPCSADNSNISDPSKFHDRPLFEVRVDNDNMCIINTDEMRDKLNAIHRKNKKLCSSGICKEKSKDRNTRIVCKCHKNIVQDECIEDTCGDTITCCKCGKNHHKHVRSGFDTASIKNVISKLSLFYSRMCSKSDNYVNQNGHKKTRICKRCHIMGRTQSENVHKRDGLKIMIKKPNDTGDVLNNDCCPCGFGALLTGKDTREEPKSKKNEKSDKVIRKSAPSPAREKPKKEKKEKPKKKNIVVQPNENENENDNVTIKPKKKEKPKKKPIVEDSEEVTEIKKKEKPKKKTVVEDSEEVTEIKKKEKPKKKTIVEESDKITEIKKKEKPKKKQKIEISGDVTETKRKEKSKKKKKVEDSGEVTEIKAKKVTKVKKSATVVDNKAESNKKPAKEKKIQKRKQPAVPVPSPKVQKKPKEIPKKPEAKCLCHHICTCESELQKRRLKDKSQQKRHHRKRKRKKVNKKQKKKQDDTKDKEWEKESLQKRKSIAKEKYKMAKSEEIRRKKQAKEEREMIKLLEREGGARRSNCLVEILVAVLSIFGNLALGALAALYHLITSPKKSFLIIQERIEDRAGTYTMIKKSIIDAWTVRKLKVCNCFRNSEKAGILADAFKEGVLYQAFADKGKTKKEQKHFELEAKVRKRRVQKRRDAALYGCRHVLLTTLRKTPCLWVYHVCPEFYPQCLSFLNLVRQFWHMMLFLAALACWTPCIVLCELTRGLCCCLLCTG